MMTITLTITKSEFDAILEYASMCGESVNDIIRKIIIQKITLKHHAIDDPKYCDYNMLIPEGISDKEEIQIIESNYNKIRAILGWKEIRI